MPHANVAILDPQRIKESDNCRRKKRIYDFVMTLSESEIQLTRNILSIKSEIAFIQFAKTLSETESQFINKLLSIYCRHSIRKTEPCEVIYLQAKHESSK